MLDRVIPSIAATLVFIVMMWFYINVLFFLAGFVMWGSNCPAAERRIHYIFPTYDIGCESGSFIFGRLDDPESGGK